MSNNADLANIRLSSSQRETSEKKKNNTLNELSNKTFGMYCVCI